MARSNGNGAKPENHHIGLVLSGGGARGAYEAGVMSVLGPALAARGERPSIYIGTSVGAVNAAYMAASEHLPADEAGEGGLQRWREVSKGTIIRPILLRQAPLSALRYAGEIVGLPGVRLPSLLDPKPFERNLDRWIDWDAVHTAEDLRQFDGRGRHAADVIRREVIEKGRRALIVYGDGHLFRVPMGETIVSLLERDSTRVFTIASPISSPTAARLETLQDNVRAWPAPSLLVLRDTTLGAAPFPFFYPAPKVIRDGVVISAPIPERWQSLAMQDQFDALLYVGPPEGITFAQLPRALCTDKSYMDTRLSRMAIAALATQTERLKEYCAAAQRE